MRLVRSERWRAPANEEGEATGGMAAVGSGGGDGVLATIGSGVVTSSEAGMTRTSSTRWTDVDGSLHACTDAGDTSLSSAPLPEMGAAALAVPGPSEGVERRPTVSRAAATAEIPTMAKLVLMLEQP